jgi:transforming growth factor-beta-induced protein
LFSGHSIGSRAGGILTETRNRVSFSVRNVKCTNGVVHIVDAVLIPNAAIASIVTTAGFTPTLSSFVGALQQAELVDALSGDGPFTVFAPTDAAFAAISQIVGGLSMEQLVEILEYHVISGVAAKSGDLSNGEVLQPLFSGHSLTVELGRRNSVSIKAEGNTVLVSMANRLCTNGVVHVVDAVLLPNIPLATQNIVEVAQSVPILSELVDAVISADLVDTLSSPGHFTVFAPTNAAFDAISKVVAGLSKRELRDVLLYHVLDQEVKSTDLKNGGVLLPQFKGHSLTVDLTNGVKILTETNSVMVTMADVQCTNGVVHIVDAVLIPNRLAVV